jgi:hypothetical protein
MGKLQVVERAFFLDKKEFRPVANRQLDGG